MKLKVARIAAAAIWAGVMAAAALGATPTTQRAIVQTGTGGPAVLKLQTVPILSPGENQVLIRVYAASVNPVDWKMRTGSGSGPAPAKPPAPRIPGLDVAGVVAAVGAGVTELKPGSAVFAVVGRAGITGLNGGYSEYVVVPAANAIGKPKNLTFAQAAGLGTAALTGARTVEQARISKGQRVLITGVAGGVGSSAAQVALVHGAHVIGTATPRHAAFLKSIGVRDVIDYTQGNWADKVKDADVVIDTVGGDTALTAFNTVKKGGTFITVASRDITAEKCADAGVVCPAADSPNAGPSAGELAREVATLASRGKFKIHVDRSFALAQAGDAQEYNREGHTEGKVVLIVNERANQK